MLVVRREKVCDGKKGKHFLGLFVTLLKTNYCPCQNKRDPALSSYHHQVSGWCSQSMLLYKGFSTKTVSRSDRHLAVALARSILCEKEAHDIQFSDSPYLCHQWLLHSRVYSASTEAVL